MDEFDLDIFKISKKGAYICACDTWLDNIDDAMDHYRDSDIDGFCKNGIKRLHLRPELYTDDYACVCGKRCNRYDITDHAKLQKTACITAYILKQNSYCKVCDLQCKSVKNYEVHCETEKHIRNMNGVMILPLDCNICKIHCTTQNQIKEHLETKKHKDMVESGKIADDKIPLSCAICGITCPSQKTIRAHLETKKHKKRASCA